MDGQPRWNEASTNSYSNADGSTNTTANSVSGIPAGLPIDSAGNPLPWGRDSIVQWARQNGFAKFIPALLQHGIEGYRFYTLSMDELKDMKIPSATLRDRVQLNAAIYRLN
ncbi:hypothetical protein GQ54DRAFT_262942, partial [Martensiomyces pterosporus]